MKHKVVKSGPCEYIYLDSRMFLAVPIADPVNKSDTTPPQAPSHILA